MTLALATRAWVPLIAYAFFLVAALTTSSSLLHFLGNPMGLEFLMGVAVAHFPRRAFIGLLIPIGLALFMLSTPGTGDVESTLAPQFARWRALTWGVPAAMIVWGALSLEPLFKSRRFDLPVAIGDASYSIYLFHPLVAYGLSSSWPVRIGAAIGVGWAMHLLVERRILAAGKHWRGLRLGFRLRPRVTAV